MKIYFLLTATLSLNIFLAFADIRLTGEPIGSGVNTAVDAVDYYEREGYDIPNQNPLTDAEYGQYDRNPDYRFQAIVDIAEKLRENQRVHEEFVRLSGCSGIKKFSQSEASVFRAQAASLSHDHANKVNTVGLNAFVGVLNGVEFLTEHNDYSLFMPHTSSSDYPQIEPIPRPGVPQEVFSKLTVPEQMVEMKEWFLAFHKQDRSIRDYTKYFKPVLCYLEGEWTLNTGMIEETPSFLDASTYEELNNKFRFWKYTGRSDSLGTIGYRPTKITKVKTDTDIPVPEIAQWTNRILCHPLKDDLPTSEFRVVDDLSPRVRNRVTLSQHTQNRTARFKIDSTLLDRLMSEVPGKDNYGAQLVDDAYGVHAHDPYANNTNQLLNVANYYRYFLTETYDPRGGKVQAISYSDENLYVAQNTQPHIASSVLDECKTVNGQANCMKYIVKMSYAVPLEIMYVTPLSSWNPYECEDVGSAVATGGRNGGLSKNTAYRGINDKYFYMTPCEFFNGPEFQVDDADTTGDNVGVFDRNGQVRCVRASGERTFIPEIEVGGITSGPIRTRYPLFPRYSECNSNYKQLDALKRNLFDATIDKTELKTVEGVDPVEVLNLVPMNESKLITAPSASNMTPEHIHLIEIPGYEVALLREGKGSVHVTSSVGGGHTHVFTLRYLSSPTYPRTLFERCDHEKECWDKHHYRLRQYYGEFSSNTVLRLEATFNRDLSVQLHQHPIDLTQDELNEINLGGAVNKTMGVTLNHTHTCSVEWYTNSEGAQFYRCRFCDGKPGHCDTGHSRQLQVNSRRYS